MTRIVLAYSESLVPATAGAGGGPESDAIPWLAARYGAEVVTLTLDFGQGRELEALRDRALAGGAARAHVLDVADEFAATFILPALKAGALAADGRSSMTALGRLIIARKLVDIAHIEATTSVAHGCPKGDTRLAAGVRALDATLTVIPLPPSVAGAQAAGTVPAPAPPQRLEAAVVELTFARGMPTAVNGVPMPLVDLIGSLDMLIGVPRGARPGILDTPSAVVLHDAHQGLQQTTSPHEERSTLAAEYTTLVGTGAWFSSEREALDRRIDELEGGVNGTVRLELSAGGSRIVDIKPVDAIRLLNVR